MRFCNKVAQLLARVSLPNFERIKISRSYTLNGGVIILCQGSEKGLDSAPDVFTRGQRITLNISRTALISRGLAASQHKQGQACKRPHPGIPIDYGASHTGLMSAMGGKRTLRATGERTGLLPNFNCSQRVLEEANGIWD
jgi:hypothetical protein